MRNMLVKIQGIKPTPPIEVILGVSGCPRVRIWRSQHSQQNDLIDVQIPGHDGNHIEWFMLTRAEQATLMDGLRRLALCESTVIPEAS